MIKHGSAMKVAYYDYVTRDLKYIESGLHFGADCLEPVNLPSDGFAGSWNSMAVVNGEVAISYEGSQKRPTKYIKRH